MPSEWSLVRLELGRTPDFPEGSASRAYLLRLPLNERWLIDATVLAQNPGMATVRRFWPNEPDQLGRVVRRGKRWVFCYVTGEDDCEGHCQLEMQPLIVGGCVTVIEPDGRQDPFRVVLAQRDGLAC